jgi:hypothetical protein
VSLREEFNVFDELNEEEEVIAIAKSYQYCLNSRKKMLEENPNDINNIKVRNVLLALKSMREQEE